MTTTLDLGYNTNMEKLAIPEYGRNIHKMVQHAIKLQDKQENSAYTKAPNALNEWAVKLLCELSA